MRILYIINNLGSGGAEKLIEELAPKINELYGKQIDILLLTNKNNVFDITLKENGIKINSTEVSSIYNPINIWKIKQYVDKGKYDVIHSHLFPSQYWVAFAKFIIKNKNIKYVTTEHSTNNRRRNNFHFRLLDKYIYFTYDYIVSITEKTQNNLIEWVNPNEKQIKKYKVIENGVNLEKYIKAKPYKKYEIKKGFTDENKLICMVGRFAEAKDQQTLIRAMEKLPSDIHLILVGEGPLLQRNMKLAKEIGVADKVHFLGFRDDIERILKTVDLVVLSSHWEGLSLSSIEGLASGKPLIASRVQGLQEVVDGHGLTFSQGNVDELYLIIKKVLIDKLLYNETAKKGLQRAKMYDINNMLKKLILLYEN